MYSHDDINQLILNTLGSQDAQVVLDALKVQLEQDKIPPMPQEGKTWGDWAFTVPYLKEELRPWTALSYQNIDLMLRTGIIRFAVDLKRAKMVSPFRNERSLQLISPDKPLADASLAALVPLLPQLMYELSWSALVYGSAFIETVWGTRTGYQLGIDDRRTSELWSVPVGFNLVPHKTVRAIKRLENGKFDGFIQNPAYGTHYYPADQRTAGLIVGSVGPNDILVNADSALVVPYNGYSRKLWGESFLTPIYPLWFWYEIIMRCLVSYTQLMGDPPRLGKAPSKKKLQVTTTGEVIDAVDYIMAVGVNLSKSNTAVIPSDVDPETKTPQYELAYMTVPERSQPFVQILEHINQQILRAALSSDKTLISSPGGGGAIGEIHAEATALHDEMVVSSWLYYLNQYFVKYLSIYNRGMEGPPIRLEIQGLDPREQQLLQSVMGVAGNTKSFDDFFYSVDWRSLGNLAGLPMLTEDEKAELKQKLQEEGLQNQMAQQEVAAQDPALQQQQQMEAKLDKLLEKPPIALSYADIERLQPVIEEEPKVYQINAPINKRKQVAAVVASLLMEGGSDDDNPFSIQLFNPFHDALGRFASKAGRVVGRTEKWAKENPKKVILGGVGLAALGITAYAVATKGNVETASAKTSAGKRVASNFILTDQESDRVSTHYAYNTGKDKLHSITVSANAIVKDLGVTTNPDVYWYPSYKAWGEAYDARNAADLGRPWYNEHRNIALFAQGFRETDGSVHISPDSTRDFLGRVDSPAKTGSLLAHELFHSRKYMPEYRGDTARIEEQLATIVEDTSYHRITNGGSGKFSKRDLSKDFWKSANSNDGYPVETRHQLFRSAAYKFRNNPGKYKHVADVVSEWLAMKNPHSDIRQWELVGIASRSWRRGNRSFEYNIQLFNPHHDALGRFASKTGSAIVSGAKKVGRGSKKLWEENKAEIITGALVGGTLAAGVFANNRFKSGLPEAKEYRQKFYDSTPTHQKILAAPAEYLARKHSYGALIARSALGAGGLSTSTVSDSKAERIISSVLPYGLAPSTFLSIAAGGTIYAKGAMLGAAASTALAVGLFGSAPAIVPIAGGVIVGSLASVMAYQLVDYAGRKFTQSYINRFAPKDDHHITITDDGTFKSISEYSQATANTVALYSVYNIGREALKSGLLFEADTIEERTVMAHAVPLVALLVAYRGIEKIESQVYVPGFDEVDGKWVLTKETADRFINLWAGENTKLFNPYHDELGRFAPKAMFVTGSSGGVSYSPGKIAQSIDRVKKDYGPLVDFKTVTCSDMACVKKNTGSNNPNILGAYTDGKLVLAPNVGSLMNRVVTHESIHARRRSQGGPLSLRSNMHRQVEEGCTELMTFRNVKENWRITPYDKEMLTVASAARRFSNGDPKRAWKFVKDVHYYNDTDVGVSAIAKYKGTPNQDDIEWMLRNRSVALEEADERFRLSEEAIYAEVRKVGNEKVNLNVDLPEEFNEA